MRENSFFWSASSRFKLDPPLSFNCFECGFSSLADHMAVCFGLFHQYHEQCVIRSHIQTHHRPAVLDSETCILFPSVIRVPDLSHPSICPQAQLEFAVFRTDIGYPV